MGSGSPQFMFVQLRDTAEAQSQEPTLVTVVIDTSSFFVSIDFITYCISLIVNVLVTVLRQI